jgi:hypothetical protein
MVPDERRLVLYLALSATNFGQFGKLVFRYLVRLRLLDSLLQATPYGFVMRS